MRCIILRTIIFLCRYATNTKSSPGSCIINAPSGNICWITVRTMIEASPLTSRISATNAKFHPDLELLMQHRGTYVRLQSTRCIRIKSDLILFNSISYFSQGEYFKTFQTFQTSKEIKREKYFWIHVISNKCCCYLDLSFVVQNAKN